MTLTIGDLVRGLKDIAWPLKDIAIEPTAPDLRVPTDSEVGAWAEAVGVDRGAAILALNVRMSQDFQGALDEEEIANHARAIQLYGDDRVGEFQEELRRETE
jgi:hypothetical protein